MEWQKKEIIGTEIDSNFKITDMKSYILIILVLCSSLLFSQENVSKDLVDNFGVNLGLISAGINYEKAIAKDLSVNAILQYDGGFYSRLGGDTQYIFASTISLEPRYYYNRQRRLNRRKNISNNVGNYIAGDLSFGPVLGTISSDDEARALDSYIVGVKYGLRRKVIGNLNFELAFGVGKLFSNNYKSETIPILDIKLQYIIF